MASAAEDACQLEFAVLRMESFEQRFRFHAASDPGHSVGWSGSGPNKPEIVWKRIGFLFQGFYSLKGYG